jgi:hypothetical protein
VDPDRPDDDYALTYNCLACPDNAKTYNDGFHIVHHANSQLHWSQLPARFLETLDVHDARDGGGGGADIRIVCFLEGRGPAPVAGGLGFGPPQAARRVGVW